MARIARDGADLIYAAANRFRESALASVDSMFTPGRPIWSSETLDELYQRFVLQPDVSGGSFEEKLAGQLSGANDDAIQLMGEIVFVHLLITSSVTGEKKRSVLASILSQMATPALVPQSLGAALDYGLTGPGTFFNTGRDRQIRFLIDWVRAWRRLPPQEAGSLLADPWAFKQQLWSVEMKGAWLQRNAVLHLLFPDVFERMVSRKHKELAIASFAGLIAGTERARRLDEDRALLEIREKLVAAYGEGMDFYATEGVAERWIGKQPLPGPATPLLDRVLAAFPGWTGFTDSRFVEEERDYKEKAAALAVSLLGREPLRELIAREAYGELVDKVVKVAQATNLLFLSIPREGDLSLLFKEDLDMPSFALALFDLLHGDGSGPDRLEMFAEYTSSRNLPTKWALPTYLLMLLHPDSDIFVKPGVTKWLLEELDAGFQMGSKASGEKYASLLEVVGALREDLAAYGPRDLIDIQGYVWVAHGYKPEEPEELEPPTPPLPPPPGPTIYEHIRDSGFHFPTWLVTDYLLALATKPFVIVSGISGTGKTKMAQLVSQFVAPDREIETVVAPGTAAFGDGFTPVQVQKSAFVYRRLTIPIGLLEDVALPDASKPTDFTVHAGGRAWQARLYVHSKARNIQVHMKPELNTWFAEHVQEGDYLGMRVRPADGMPEFDLELRTAPSERRRELRPSERVAFLSVRPDWTDNRDLLGYYNPLMGVYSSTELLRLLLRAQANPDEPHFVILDEMNLAKVEYYFSDFLSAMESETEMLLHDATDDQYVEVGEVRLAVPRRLRVPANVFFTGTVNVDETTYMFSPKVLDRANTMEFNEVHLESYGGSLPPDGDQFMLRGGITIEHLLAYRPPSPEDWEALPHAYKDRLRQLHDVLEPDHLHFGYRVVNEVARYLNLAASFVGEESLETAFDLQILQKVLPKLAGNRGKLEKPLWNLLQWCVDPEGEPDALSAATLESIDINDATYPRAAAKLKRMLRVVQMVGFVSFVE